MSETPLYIVVPCYDEAKRLRVEAFESFVAAASRHRLLFVDDGSRDDTRRILRQLAGRRPDAIAVLEFDRNRGKAEAVRRGLLEAFARGGDPVGYWDADLSTPLEELAGFAAALADPAVQVVYGSRLKLLGRRIERRLLRHYLGRVHATFASMVLELGVYDTQCGAKLLRASAANRALLEQPFLTRWLFDVEILARMIEQAREDPSRHPDRAVVELPLATWRDVGGSKVRLRDGLRALYDLLRIRRRHRLGRARSADEEAPRAASRGPLDGRSSSEG